MELEEIEGLYESERALLDILRSFDFLRQENYHVNRINYGSRVDPSLSYLCYSSGITVHIIGNESGPYSVQIQRKKPFAFKREKWVFVVNDYFNCFDSGMKKNGNYSLGSQARFIQRHLMAVIRNEKWVDEVLEEYKNSKKQLFKNSAL